MTPGSSGIAVRYQESRKILAIQGGDFLSGQIIAILAAILFPVFARAREKARTASCQSNLKQIELAAMMYAQDYDETLPSTYRGIYPAAVDPWDSAAHGFVGPYIRNSQILVCPSNGRARSYASNQAGPHPMNGRVRMAEIAKPAETISFADGYIPPAPDYNAGNVCCALSQGQTAQTTKDQNMNIHSGGKNYGFVDGHVKWMKVQQTFTPENLWDIN
ncbi:MAG: hypothetical protein AUJ92_04150 [Armatimonadetes bacterium CG2_30_59_28]|nr:MAG: hypothetical protein AUJ92_04150 [Armatimonadetes bacterium CG2_30_59_28]